MPEGGVSGQPLGQDFSCGGEFLANGSQPEEPGSHDELALTLYEDGRYFAGLPFFEKYKYDPDSFPEVDYSSAGGDLLKEMQLDNEARKDRTCGDGFERVPFDYYEQLQETLVDMIPDFRIRLKVDPRTRKMVFAADVHSVFDICWFTLAKKLSEDVTPEEKGTSADVKPAHQGMVMSCPFCGEAYIRTANRAVTCGKPECHRARKAMNKRNSRKKQKIAALKSNPAGKAEEQYNERQEDAFLGLFKVMLFRYT